MSIIEANKYSIRQLLETVKISSFIIPEYQRSYAWKIKEIDQLLNDLYEFTVNNLDNDDNITPQTEYFLGNMVCYSDQTGTQYIIDGQQRITTLFLLLRAIYSRLQEELNKTTDKKTTNYERLDTALKSINPLLWQTLDTTTNKPNYSKPHLISESVTDDERDDLYAILSSGQPKNTSNYAANFEYLGDKYDEIVAQNAYKSKRIFTFIHAILNQTVIMQIKTKDFNTALTVFETINNRGMQLSESDIFKVQIYKELGDEQAQFIEKWKELEEYTNQTNETMTRLFNYYSSLCKAYDQDYSTNKSSLLNYFTKQHPERLLKPIPPYQNTWFLNLLDTICSLCGIMNNGKGDMELDIRITKAIDILRGLGNYEAWKHAVVCYYCFHIDKPDFTNLFLSFLHKLIAEIILRSFNDNNIRKTTTYLGNLIDKIKESPKPTFCFDGEFNETVKSAIINRNATIILRILAYNNPNQTDLLPMNWEIEHIFPRTYNSIYFGNLSDNEAQKLIEHIGNLLPLEKKLNIKAGNNYFDRKKQIYLYGNDCRQPTKLAITKDFALTHNDWKIEDIEKRDNEILEEIKTTLTKWQMEYNAK